MCPVTYFGEMMENNSTSEKGKKKTKFCSKTMCTHSKWANEQALKTELCIQQTLRKTYNIEGFA